MCVKGRLYFLALNAYTSIYFDCINVYLLIAKNMTFLD